MLRVIFIRRLVYIYNYTICALYCRSKDDENIAITTQLKSKVSKLPPRDPNTPPKGAALISGKYVTYTRVTRDLAVLFFTAGNSLIRNYYLIKLIECYAETLGITLGQLGIDTDSFGVNYGTIINDFQQHLLYGFMVAVLVSMSNTSLPDLARMAADKGKDHSRKNIRSKSDWIV